MFDICKFSDYYCSKMVLSRQRIALYRLTIFLSKEKNVEPNLIAN